MKKIIASLVAAALLSFAAFADDEGLKVSGYLRAGATDTTEGSVYTTSTWMHGDYFGGATRLRVNVDYSKAFGGLTFRYQQTKTLNDFFNKDNLKWAMGYANFADGQVIAEAGVLTDRFTRTGGWEDDGIGYGNGARLVFVPQAVAGLTVVAQASDEFADKYTEADDKVKDKKANKDDIKFDKKVLGFSAKYEKEAFFVTGGAALAGKYYGSVGITSVENLSFVVEAFCDKTADSDEKDNTMICAWAEYTGVEKVTLGLVVYAYVADDAFFFAKATDQKDPSYPTFVSINPAVAYDLNDLVQLSAEATVYLPKSWDEDKYGKKLDSYATISPAVTFKASDKATATVSGLISTNKDYAKHAFTAGVCYKF